MSDCLFSRQPGLNPRGDLSRVLVVVVYPQIIGIQILIFDRSSQQHRFLPPCTASSACLCWMSCPHRILINALKGRRHHKLCQGWVGHCTFPKRYTINTIKNNNTKTRRNETSQMRFYSHSYDIFNIVLPRTTRNLFTGGV